MIKLPPVGNPLRNNATRDQLLDIIEQLDPANRAELQWFGPTLRKARAWLVKTPGAVATTFVCQRVNGDLVWIEVVENGDFTTVWTFGNVRD